jgi:predicted nucleotidyltransferase
VYPVIVVVVTWWVEAMLVDIEVAKKRIRAILPVIRKEFKVKSVGIFGSYVRGEQKSESDLDVLVEFEEPISLLKLVSLENYLSDLLGVKVDLVPKADLRPELRSRILSEEVTV